MTLFSSILLPRNVTSLCSGSSVQQFEAKVYRGRSGCNQEDCTQRRLQLEPQRGRQLLPPPPAPASGHHPAFTRLPSAAGAAVRQQQC